MGGPEAEGCEDQGAHTQNGHGCRGWVALAVAAPWGRTSSRAQPPPPPMTWSDRDQGITVIGSDEWVNEVRCAVPPRPS